MAKNQRTQRLIIVANVIAALCLLITAYRSHQASMTSESSQSTPSNSTR